MDRANYKRYHETQMMFNNGTSIGECSILLFTIPFNVFFSLWISSFLYKPVLPIFEFVITILPVILNVTLLSEGTHIILLNLTLLYLTIVMMNAKLNALKGALHSEIRNEEHLITCYRASTNFVSAICILAVDFEIFPRKFAKTESYGFGFMDLGVGFFICSHGLVEKHKKNQVYILKTIKTVSTLFALGIVRLLLVKAVDYQEHVSEYGMHWNFFFTLAMCRIITNIILLLSNYGNPLCYAIICGIIHEILLNLGLKEWVLSEIPRNSFLSANREGLTSCLGYVCMYFAASSISKLLTKNLTYYQLMVKLIIMSVLTWLGTVIAFKTIGVSRRIANLGYSLWIVSLTLSVITLFLIGDLTLLAIKKNKNNKKCYIRTPYIFQSINKNGLFFFLLSNLLTGLINCFFKTLFLGKLLSISIIIIYMVIVCSITHYLQLRNIIIKI